MDGFLRKLALAAAVALLAPVLICATGSQPAVSKGSSARIGAEPGVHCFCHHAVDGRSGAIRAPEAPAAGSLYLCSPAPRLGAGPFRRFSIPFMTHPTERPAPEPVLRPPIRTA